MAHNKYLLCARVVGTHGVDGKIRVENYTDSPRVLAKMKKVYTLTPSGEYVAHNVERASIQKEAVLLKLDTLTRLEDAIIWKGKELYADRADFHLGSKGFFIADVVGLPVYDEVSGETVGTVKEVLTGRIQDIYVISDVRGGEFMIPYVSEFIKNVTTDGDNALVTVHLIDGMREEPKE